MSGLVIANWKMHGSLELIAEFSKEWRALPRLTDVNAVLCPPAPYLASVSGALEGVALGAQNCADRIEGAFTGEVSVQMLSDLGCGYVIIGHSERRALYNETDAQVAVKAQLAIAQGLQAVVCVGETLAHRDADQQEWRSVCQQAWPG